MCCLKVWEELAAQTDWAYNVRVELKVRVWVSVMVSACRVISIRCGGEGGDQIIGSGATGAV